MTKNLLAGVAVAAALLAPARAYADDDPKIEFTKYTLPNGLEVLLVPDRTVPVVSVSVWYHVGSGNENYGKSGFAHLFEHMMFQGSKHVPDDKHFDILKKIGSEFINGTTNTDRTNYFEVVPSNQLETALWLESDRMGYLLDKLTVPSLQNQIEVVRNERRQRIDNVPYGKASFAISGALYPEGHPYRYQVIGKHEDLAAASVDDVKNFFKTWYVPANATLAISGDFDNAEAKALVEKWFGKFPVSQKPKLVPVPMPVTKTTELTVEDSFAKLRQIEFTWHSPPNFAPGDAELDFVASALGREGTGRLYKDLVYKQLAQSVSSNQGGEGLAGEFSITVTLRGDSDAELVKKTVLDEVARVTREDLTQKEIQRLVTQVEASAIRRLETAFGRAETLQQFNHYLGDPDRITWNLDRYRKATPAAIKATAAQWLTPDHVVIVTTIPAKGDKK